jgi:hypothetical protein
MFEETHRRLARELSKSLSLSPNQAKLLDEGSVYPDYQESFPHHEGREETIKNLLQKSRTAFLKEDDECFSTLGMAFHFIEDKWTLRARSRDKHTKWEELISKAVILNDQEFIELINSSVIPSKFKSAYISFINILTNEIESPVFWGDIAVKYSYFEPVINLSIVLREEYSKDPSKKLITDKNIKMDEEKNGFRQRIFVLANYAWASKYPPNLLAFRSTLTKEQLGIRFYEEPLTRFTTPEIDLNVAFIVRREIGKRVLSNEFKWMESFDIEET